MASAEPPARSVQPSLGCTRPFVDHHPRIHASSFPVRVAPARRRLLLDDRQGIEQYGEVVIIRGDSDLLGNDDGGGIGIVYNGFRNDPGSIAYRFFSAYPDEFDAIIVLTTFPDRGSPGATAYHIAAQQDVAGIGSQPGRPAIFDESLAWGSTGGRFHSFVNMKGVESYEGGDNPPIDDPSSWFYPVLGQEVGHRWLSFARYVTRDGEVSRKLLGRDSAHWSPMLQAQASVMDGNQWEEKPDGWFGCAARQRRFSQLDLYLMGLLPAREVAPFYFIGDARTRTGRVVDPAADWWLCEDVTGTREDIGVGQIIAAEGPRVPSDADSPHRFRMAFVLITRPEELAGDVIPIVQRVERARLVWERKFIEYTDGRGSACTQVSAPCGEPVARILEGRIAEAEGEGADGDGVIEPGERVTASFTVLNDGPVAATAVPLEVAAPLVDFDPSSRMIDDLPPGGRARLTFTGVFHDDPMSCNQVISVRAEATTKSSRFRGFAQALAGAVDYYRNDFDRDAGGWGVDLHGTDSAKVGAFRWGRPRAYGYHGYFTFQPDGGAGGGGHAFFTGPERGNVFTGVTYALGPGESTLWSPPIDLGPIRRPRVHYAAWFEAMRFEGTGLFVVDEDLLILEGSNDGVKWFKLDQVDGFDARWRPRVVDPANPVNGQVGLDVTRPVQFRFKVNRAGDDELVEAGVDEFRVVGDAAGCYAPPSPEPPRQPPIPLGCATSPLRGPAPGGRGGPVALLATLLVAALHPRRRRSRPTHHARPRFAAVPTVRDAAILSVRTLDRPERWRSPLVATAAAGPLTPGAVDDHRLRG